MLSKYFYKNQKELEVELNHILKIAGRGSSRDNLQRLARLLYILHILNIPSKSNKGVNNA